MPVALSGLLLASSLLHPEWMASISTPPAAIPSKENPELDCNSFHEASSSGMPVRVGLMGDPLQFRFGSKWKPDFPDLAGVGKYVNSGIGLVAGFLATEWTDVPAMRVASLSGKIRYELMPPVVSRIVGRGVLRVASSSPIRVTRTFRMLIFAGVELATERGDMTSPIPTSRRITARVRRQKSRWLRMAVTPFCFFAAATTTIGADAHTRTPRSIPRGSTR